jgi:hypothetical protein
MIMIDLMSVLFGMAGPPRIRRVAAGRTAGRAQIVLRYRDRIVRRKARMQDKRRKMTP